MSKDSVPDKAVEENPRSYPWGENTGTYKLWLTLITINILFVTGVFLFTVEIPLIADLSNPDAVKGSSGSLLASNSTGLTLPGEVVQTDSPVSKWLGEYGMWVIVANIVTVWVLKTVGKWLTVVQKWCRNLCACKWYKPWCCLGKLFCWFVTVLKWVTWVVAIASSVITSVLVWVSQQPNLQG